jgi:GTP-binding protein
MFTLAIVGRPNVGKSTLFNRLCKKKMAIVDDRPGVTRDWRESDGWILDQPIRVLDTAGLEDRFDGSMEARMRQQTERAIDQSDAVLFVVDGRDGITPIDEHFASWMRRIQKPVILAVNKCDHEGVVQTGLADAYRLGLGEPTPISSAHGFGIEDLYARLKPHMDAVSADMDDADGIETGLMIHEEDLDHIEGDENYTFDTEDMDDPEKPVKVAIVGRPNVGKSTLMNALLGEERVMTGPEAGITRDAIAAKWVFKGRSIRLVDTAGLRKRARVVDRLEKLSTDDTMRAVRLAHVVILVLDATRGIEAQDMNIARHIIDEGRILIIALNKWDAVQNKSGLKKDIQTRIEKSLGQLADVVIVPISAIKEHHLSELISSALELFEGWSKRVSTSPLNRWLDGAVSRHPPTLVRGRPNTLKYITQINVKPPTFALWCMHPDELPDSYKRYLIKSLKETFHIPPVPVRLLLRKTKNPYTD